MTTSRRLRLWLTVTGLLVACGCTAAESQEADAPATPATTASATPSAAPSSGPSDGPTTPTAPESSAAATTSAPEPPHPVSLPALMDKQIVGRGLRLGDVIVRTDAYTQRYVTYRSGDLTISGILNRPTGRGPYPVLVLAHGYIDPAVYANGQGLRREQDWLARAGYAVLHVDYRNHAGSDDAPAAERRLRLGYTEDVVSAVLAVRRSGLRWLDGDRVGLLGRSMGGGVVYNALVTRPGLVDAAVVFAPVSSNTVDNFNRWTRGEPVAGRILRAYGTPRQNPQFWRDVSPRTFFDQITEPVLIHHGTADDTCPLRWSRQTLRAMKRAGVDARMFTYPGEPHAFIADWPQSMRRTVSFLDRRVKARA